VHIFYPRLKMSTEQDLSQLLLPSESSSTFPPGPKTKSTSSKPSGMDKSLMTAEGEFLDESPFSENEPESIKRKMIQEAAYQMANFP
jgi:hypothetical protein